MKTNNPTKKQQKLFELISNGWIPYQVTAISEHLYTVNSGSSIGIQHVVRCNPVLGLTCSHEYGEYNEDHPCNHIKAVQSFNLSYEGFSSFDQEVHVRCAYKSLKATKTKKEWEWLITDARGLSVGCMGVTVQDGLASWWTTYEGNHQATWDNCHQAIEYLLAVVSF